RIEIINLRTRSKPLDPDVNVAALALRTDGYSGAELVSVCMEATKSYMKRWVELETLGEEMSTTEARVTQQDFDHALEKVVSRITPEMTRR
ncbi:AAA+-type ATPase, partial [Cryomyces antarcticus]